MTGTHVAGRPHPSVGLRAIETSYAGHRFRSRSEARWAVFFDHLRIEWKYEHEGFETPDGFRYLPDFFLPSIGVFAEVKGGLVTTADSEKMLRFVYDAPYDATGLLLLGDIPDQRIPGPHHVLATNGHHGRHPRNRVEKYDVCVVGDNHGGYELCPVGWPRLSYLAPDGSFGAPDDPHDWEVARHWPITNHASVSRGWEAARSARFEHGESPTLTTAVVYDRCSDIRLIADVQRVVGNTDALHLSDVVVRLAELRPGLYGTLSPRSLGSQLRSAGVPVGNVYVAAKPRRHSVGAGVRRLHLQEQP